MTCALVPAALFTLGFLRAASADVATMDDFAVTLNGGTVFNDTFSINQTLVGGFGGVVPSGLTFPDGSAALYSVLGTVTEAGHKAILDTAQGALLIQTPPFFPQAKATGTTLLTGPPGSPFALTPNVTFSTTGVYDLTVPPTTGAFYQVLLSDRAPQNNFLGDVISMAVVNCGPDTFQCSGAGPFIQLIDANALTNTIDAVAQAPLDTSNQEILLELSHPTAGNHTIVGSYAYVNNGIEGPLVQLGTYGGLFQDLNYTQAGTLALAPVPEPSSLALLGASVFGLAWLRRRKADCDRLKIETHS
jgi:hypothetical protein